MTRGMTAIRWGAGLALVATAWAIAAATPDDDIIREPFRTTTTVGAAFQTRTLAGEITAARLGASATADDGWEADGTWLVLDLELAAVQTDVDRTIEHARLTLPDGTVYSASERPETSLYDAPVHVGLPRVGSIAFEIPEDAASERVRIDLGTELDPAADALVTLDLDLGALERAETVALLPLGWAS